MDGSAFAVFQDRPELTDVFREHLLTRLSPSSLLHLSCCCRALWTLVNESIGVWRAAAHLWMPHQQPSLQQSDLPTILRALQRHSTAMSNLRQGQVAGQTLLAATWWSHTSASFSPDDQLVALQSDQRLAVFDVGDGALRCNLLDRVRAVMPPDTADSIHECVPVWQSDSRHMTLGVSCYSHVGAGAYLVAFMQLGIFSGDDSLLSTVHPQPSNAPPRVGRPSTVFARHGALAAVQCKSLQTTRRTIQIVEPRTGTLLMSASTTSQSDYPVWSWNSTHLALASKLINVRDHTSRPHTERDRALSMEFSHDDTMLGFTSTTHDAIFVHVASGAVHKIGPSG
ncbi:hypothetical protein WJX73_001970 [Symbiochloris irregularis]|uniref:F-box domain-containing protein n=1 Tax=Symbiochloris irregularis TaxID=706552 RepID=A0AAW1NYA4_9CHLO